MWHKTDDAGGPAGKYLLNDRGEAVWLVDPGINGVHSKRPDGTEVRKFEAPKATLVSYIIKGILDQQLPKYSETRGSDCLANCHLALPSAAAR